MSKEEIIEMFDKLEADIVALQQMASFKNRILELVDIEDEEAREKLLTEFDALEDQLQIVEMLG